MLAVNDLSFQYKNGVRALTGVSLEVRAGEIVCILGHNGAGKSTLMRCINGLLRPTSGTVRIDGDDSSRMRPAQIAKRIGLCFQNPDAQLFCDTVEKEVRFGARTAANGTAQAEDSLESALMLLDLHAVRDRNPYELSLSMRKRVAIASVVAMRTPLLILDEPTGNLDRHGVELVVSLVGDLARRGVAVVLVTHDIDLAHDHADRIVVLSGGTVHCQGSPRAVFSDARLREAGILPPTIDKLSAALGTDPQAIPRGDVVSWLKNLTASAGGSR
jgi:energy-coupling factor transporter ATP-binding protein EcfA2